LPADVGSLADRRDQAGGVRVGGAGRVAGQAGGDRGDAAPGGGEVADDAVAAGLAPVPQGAGGEQTNVLFRPPASGPDAEALVPEVIDGGIGGGRAAVGRLVVPVAHHDVLRDKVDGGC